MRVAGNTLTTRSGWPPRGSDVYFLFSRTLRLTAEVFGNAAFMEVDVDLPKAAC